MNTKTARVFPIRFARLFDGSKFTIFAEPSRDIRKSNDPTVYIKVCDAYSVAENDPEKVAILYPEDLVNPRTRGQ